MAQWVQALAAKPDILRSLGPRGTHRGGKEATAQLSSDFSACTHMCMHTRTQSNEAYSSRFLSMLQSSEPENWGRQTTPTSTWTASASFLLLIPLPLKRGGGGLPILLKGSCVQASKECPGESNSSQVSLLSQTSGNVRH